MQKFKKKQLRNIAVHIVDHVVIAVCSCQPEATVRVGLRKNKSNLRVFIPSNQKISTTEHNKLIEMWESVQENILSFNSN